MTVMPSSQFFSSVIDVRSVMIMISALVLLIGAVIALVLARMQYRPISSLVEFASSRYPETQNNGKHSYRNELERIRSALQDYSSRMDIQEPFARNHYLSTLIKVGNTEHLSPELTQLFDLNLNKHSLFVMVVSWNEAKPSNMDHRSRIIHRLARFELPELEATGYGVELTQLDQFAIIINFDTVEALDELAQVKQITEQIRSMLINTFAITPMIGTGGCYHHLHELNQSYIEACSAFDLLVPGEFGSVALFADLSKTPSHSFWIPNHVQLKLTQSLKQGNYEIASQMIRSSVDSLTTSSCRPFSFDASALIY